MGANPTQAFGVLLFLVAFTFLAAGMALGGNVILTAAAILLLAASARFFLKAKPWENQEDE